MPDSPLAGHPPHDGPPRLPTADAPEMTTRLLQATRDLLRIRRTGSAGEAELDRAGAVFLDAVRATADSGELRDALDLDSDRLLLPPDLKNVAYERLLQLNGRDPATLREYAWHLRIYGPDWDDRADALVAEADRADSRS